MSTRCNVILKDSYSKIHIYRHSDGYPEGAGEDLKDFVKGYTDGSMRLSAGQSAGWLILRGHVEYLYDWDFSGKEAKEIKLPFTGKPRESKSGSGWKVGAYEPTDQIHGDIEYLYTIDLEKRTLTCNAMAFDAKKPGKKIFVVEF